MCVYLFWLRRSLISTSRSGRKGDPQKGQVLLRLESSAVHPAMISSSYTRHSQVLQREQLDIRTWHTHTHTHTRAFTHTYGNYILESSSPTEMGWDVDKVTLKAG